MSVGKVATNQKIRVAESKVSSLKSGQNSSYKNKGGSGISEKEQLNEMPSATNDKKSIVDEILGDLSKSSAAKQIVLGTASGWLTGFVTMKVGKVAAVALGGGILMLQVAQHKGYININWDKIQRSADKVVEKIEKEATGRQPDMTDKLEKYLDSKLDKAKNMLKANERKARRWYHSFINNNGHGGYELQELHLFIASFAAGVTFGFATA